MVDALKLKEENKALLVRAEKAEADLTHVLTSMDTGTMLFWQKKHDDLMAKWFKAEAACAEMRSILPDLWAYQAKDCPVTSGQYVHALSFNSGKGWCSPERRKAMEEILDSMRKYSMCHEEHNCNCPYCRWEKLKPLTPL